MNRTATARHMANAHRALTDATEAREAGLTPRVEMNLRSAVEQLELAGHTGPLYKATVGDLAAVMFSRTTV
jgi:hypothetical protein